MEGEGWLRRERGGVMGEVKQRQGSGFINQTLITKNGFVE